MISDLGRLDPVGSGAGDAFARILYSAGQFQQTEAPVKINVAAALSFGIVLSGACAPCAPAASAPDHIQNLQGCFRVSYRFVEDGRRDFEIKDALEWIALKQQPGAYLITHYGLIGVGEVMQHYTETWSLLPDGRWRQDVGPSRYTCISEVRMGQLHCSSPGAAKPTRDQRQLYDLLNRVSTIQITPKGWVQSEMNDKVTKEGKVVATEVGWIEYRRPADDAPCDTAKKLYPSE
jgi:hypothetical protein